MATQCAIYTRVSSEKQAAGDKVSMKKQLRLCQEYAARMGWQVAGEYSDPGISGRKWEERPGLQALLADAAAGQFSVLLCYDTDRAARANEGFSRLAMELKTHGLLLATVNGGITDLRNPNEELTYTVKGAVATYEAQNLVRKMREARAEYAAQGRWGQATYILGYHWNRELRRPVLDEKEAEAVREAYRLAGDLRSCEAIAAELNTRGFTTRGNGGRSPLWWGGMVRKVLTDERYRGVWYTAPGVPVRPEYGPCRLLRDPEGKPQRDVADRLIVEPAAVIVSDQEWEAAQATVSMHRKVRRPMGTMTGHFLLTGMIRCGRCGSRITTRYVQPKSGGAYPYYVCVHHRPRAEGHCDLPSVNGRALEDVIWREIQKLRDDPALVVEAARLSNARGAAKAREEEKAAYGQIKSCQQRAARIRDAYEAGVYDLGTLRTRLAEVGEEEVAARERLERAQARVADEDNLEVGIISMQEALKGFDPEARNTPEARKLLLRLRAQVTVYGPDEALLEWYGAASDALCSPTVPLWPSG